MIKQRTLKKTVHTDGIGVHSGETVSLTLQPAPEETGIIFRRTDLTPVQSVPARIDYIGRTDLCTCLVKDNVHVATIEHLLSALSGLGIDNCYVDLSHPEMPIMDGSAAPFIALIESAGVATQQALKKFIRIKKPVEVQQGEKWAKLSPFHGFSVSFEIAFTHPVIAQYDQKVVLEMTPRTYVDAISRARTFGFLADYEKMLQNKLAMGASLENTVVVGDDRVMNEGGLRYPEEFVKHKVLDAIGDLYLLGHNIVGAFSAYKSGHALNSSLIKKLLSEPDAWEIVTFERTEDAPASYATL